MTETPSLLKVLRELVGVHPLDERRARGETGPAGADRGGLYGGLMIAQCLSACAHTVPPGAVPDSLHANLLRGGHPGEPVEFCVERVRDGRSLQHREVRGYQGDELIVQTTVVSSIPVNGLDWQRPLEPVVAPPELSPAALSPWAQTLARGVFEVAHPVSEDAGPGPAHPLWIRSRMELPEDPWLNGAVRAYWSDLGMNWSARTTHNRLDDEEVASVSATHSLWFHRPTPTHEWHLLDVDTESIFSNQAFVKASLFDGAGRLSASISQGVFLRRTAQGSGTP
jgi:acyl-CoA thioesterase-2